MHVFYHKHFFSYFFPCRVQVRGNINIEGASTDLNSPWIVFFEAGDIDTVATVTAMLKEGHEPSKSAKYVYIRYHRIPPGTI